MKIVRRILPWLVALLVPLALIFLAMRLLLTSTFVQIEYRMPGFPADEFGFTLEDRLEYAPIAIRYLLNDADISYLGDLTFPDGSPLYNERELSHMLDVKNVVQPALRVGYFVWFLLLAMAAWARWGGWWPEYRRGLSSGGWLTIGLVVVAAIGAAISFWQFFTLFHALFFEGDTWQFLFSDTLIRLFPLRFWQDTFIAVGVIVVGVGLGLALGLRRKAK